MSQSLSFHVRVPDKAGGMADILRYEVGGGIQDMPLVRTQQHISQYPDIVFRVTSVLCYLE